MPPPDPKSRFDAAMAAYGRAASRADLREVLSELSALEMDADALPAQQAVQLQIAIASIEDEMGMGDEARARLETAKALAEEADAHQRLRLGYYLTISYVREELVDEARATLAYTRAQLTADSSEEAALSLHFLDGAVAEAAARWEEAERAYRRCAQRAGSAHQSYAASALSGLARVAIIQRRFDDAALLLESAEDFEGGDYGEAYNRGLLAYAWLARGSITEARAAIAACLDAAGPATLSDLAASAHVAEALCAWHEADLDAARAALRRSVARDVSPTNREICLLLTALFDDVALPEVTQRRAASLRTFLLDDSASPTSPLHAVLAALQSSRRRTFCLSTDDGALTTPDASHDLRHRQPMRRILTRLVEAQHAGEGSIATGDLFEAGWPDTRHVGPNGFRRVYTELHRLRELGLEIVSIDGGYRLLTEVLVEDP